MDNHIIINSLEFEPYFKEDQILEAIKPIADQINREYQELNPLFIGVLNGSFMFCADLMKAVHIPCDITFIKISSYAGLNTTGEVKETMGLSQSITGRHVILIEDIVDTGITAKYLLDTLAKENPASLKIASLLFKPEALKEDVKLDYCCIQVPVHFFVGYGLDFNGKGRNLRHLYKLVDK